MPSLRRDPVLIGLALLGIGVMAAFLGGLGTAAPRLQLLWVTTFIADVVCCVFAYRVSRVPGLSRPARRFWRMLAGGTAFFVLGDGLHTLLVLKEPRPEYVVGSLPQSVMLICGMGAMVVSMLRYPSPTATAGERLRSWLDSATVLVGGAALAWCFAVSPTASAGGDVVTIAVATGIVLAATFGLVKMVVTGTAPATRAAAIPMIVAATAQGLSMFLPAGGASWLSEGAGLVLRVLPSILLAAGPRIQEVQARRDPTLLAPRRHRPHSLLPYLAMAITFLAMLVALPGTTGARVWGVVIGVMIGTGLVVFRQILAFRDNSDLIRRLDTTLIELRSREQQLREQASTDGLTGLYNRNAFADIVSSTLDEGHGREQFTVLIVDLDDFKTVNDTLGHAVGDTLLMTVADRLRAAVREADIVARMGGDEFAILLRDAAGPEAEALAARVLTEVSRPIQVDDHALLVRASIGMAPVSTGADLDELLRNADIAMYAAKDRGKSNFVRYAPDMGARIMQTAELGTRLREAIGTDQFTLVYQPIVDLDTGRLAGAEALVRWVHPVHGPTPPAEFIPIAESTGLIVPLGRWILRQACQQAARWTADSETGEPIAISVNVAGRQLREPGFVDEVAAVLAETGLPASQLTIEVTESATLGDSETLAVLHALRRLGVGLALDDFGTAASSLGLLLTCPVSALKLDRSFVDGVTTAKRQAAVATAVVRMARALDLDVVAEGVETTRQAEFLRDLGYRKAQGFLYARPVPPQELARMLWPAPAPLR